MNVKSHRKSGLNVTSVHNHGLFNNPKLMYMRWEPTEFA
ncbi:DUF1259 domain-containing protein [Lysinibacillus fusiformis]